MVALWLFWVYFRSFASVMPLKKLNEQGKDVKQKIKCNLSGYTLSLCANVLTVNKRKAKRLFGCVAGWWRTASRRQKQNWSAGALSASAGRTQTNLLLLWMWRCRHFPWEPLSLQEARVSVSWAGAPQVGGQLSHRWSPRFEKLPECVSLWEAQSSAFYNVCCHNLPNVKFHWMKLNPNFTSHF